MSLRQNIFRGLRLAIVAVGVSLGTLQATATLVQAQSCRSSSYLPSASALTLQHASGTIVSLQRGNYNFRPTVHVWINGSYAGQYYIPLTLAGGQIQVRIRMQLRYETWLGKVRQVYKAVPYVIVCGNWYGALP